MATEESTPIGNRGVYAGDQEPGSNNISYLSLTTEGVAVDFGDLNFTSVLASAVSSRTRGIFTHSWGPGNSQQNALDFVTIATAGNGTDFGDRTIGTFNGTGSSNQTRGIFSGGHTPSLVDNMDYVTISSTGNAIDFGDTYLGSIYSHRSCSNPTRMIMGGGGVPSNTNVIHYVTIASTGDSLDFGDLTSARGNLISCGNATRGFWIAGGSNTKTIDFVTTTTLGNASDFGDCGTANNRGSASNAVRGIVGDTGSATFITIATLGNTQDFTDTIGDRAYQTACASRTRVVWGGGETAPPVNIMDFVQIMTQGNAIDFGDLTDGRFNAFASSNGHGGLG